ncbi:glycerophosphodiester phosphodiesterase family protein [Erythrobacter sp. W53]|uniref:glycerophosphodiester phosphodiesterase family protein n=1 Tax=Erythrobacter sp. W53 TaxID=3425947 RepID=UPI003D769E20
MSERTIPDWLTAWEFAHRGLHNGTTLIENSLSAAKAAIAAGMGIECDIQRSGDDHPMVFHDWELSRLTSVEGLTAQHSRAALEQLTLGHTDDLIPSFETFLQMVDGRAPLLIELKSLPDYDVERSCEIVAASLAGYAGDHAVMSFDPRVSGWFAEHSRATTRGLVCTDTLDHGWLSKWREAGVLEACQPDFLACDIRDLPSDMASEWRASGKPLLTWTVRSAELRERALRETDALISEGAGLARASLA